MMTTLCPSFKLYSLAACTAAVTAVPQLPPGIEQCITFNEIVKSHYLEEAIERVYMCRNEIT